MSRYRRLVVLFLGLGALGLFGCLPNLPHRPLPPAVGVDVVKTEIAVATVPAVPLTPPPEDSDLPAAGSARFTHGDRSRPYIALTFDACQSTNQPAGYDEAIIQILTQTGTPATLFLGGLWMQRHPAQTRALAANPLFELGNHSWSHADFSHLTAEEIDLERTQKSMLRLTGREPTLFRFPYDVDTPEALAVVSRHGLRAISGDILSGDPDPNISARAMVKAITSQVQNGSIVIMHMNSWGWHTAEALPAVIRQLRQQGYTLVTVSQLLELDPAKKKP
jgi:peptidoglycan/xylan/chitin deacetylase (PgdA/CDA1 family)